MPILNINPANPEEQGSFCNTESQIHYNNVSRDEALEEVESSMRRGDEVTDDIIYSSTNDRFNLSSADADRMGSEYPAKHEPGR